jgi:hypothetical protein
MANESLAIGEETKFIRMNGGSVLTDCNGQHEQTTQSSQDERDTRLR